MREIRQQRLQQRRERLKQARDNHQLALLHEPVALTQQRRGLLDPVWSNRLDQLLELHHDPETVLEEEPALGLLRLLGLPPDRRALKTWLVARDLLDPHQPSSLRGSVWSGPFAEGGPETVEQLLSHAGDICAGDDTRVDLTAQRVYTLDDSATREIDDGLALEPGRWSLDWVHIADPARLINRTAPRP